VIVRRAHIHDYALPYRRPLIMLGKEHDERRGSILFLENENGVRGFGDMPPFPGLSMETLAQARQQARAFFPRLHKKNIAKIKDINDALPGELLPSVRFAIESALLDLWATASGRTMAELFHPRPLVRIRINALLTDPAQTAEAIEGTIAAGYRAVKIKVGRGDIDAEAKMVNTVRRITPAVISIRLDANRAWSFDEALRFAAAIRDCEIEYIEEPLRNWRDLGRYHDATGLPTALDESLRDCLSSPPRGVAAFVIKPGVDGGVFDVIRLIKLARGKGIKPVLSSPFLSAVGLNMALNLAAAFISQHEVTGLGTFDFLQDDFLNSPIKVERGALDVAAFGRALDVLRIEESGNE